MVEIQGYHFFYAGNADERKMIINMRKLGVSLEGIYELYLNYSIRRPTDYHMSNWLYIDLDAAKFTKTGRLHKKYHDYYWRVKT